MVTITNGVLILEGITITGESPDLPLISGTNNNTLQAMGLHMNHYRIYLIL